MTRKLFDALSQLNDLLHVINKELKKSFSEEELCRTGRVISPPDLTRMPKLNDYTSVCTLEQMHLFLYRMAHQLNNTLYIIKEQAENSKPLKTLTITVDEETYNSMLDPKSYNDVVYRIEHPRKASPFVKALMKDGVGPKKK